MAAVVNVPGGAPDEPPGCVVITDDLGAEREVPIIDQLFIGRECAGIADTRRLVLPDPEISRTHLEIRLDAVGDQAFVIDTSTNGTLLNGARLERAVPVPIRPGDRISIGDVTLVFRSRRFTAAPGNIRQQTRARFNQTSLVMVVGDIVNYSTISQLTDEGIMARSLHALWHRLGGVLHEHHGTLSYYAGDALFAVWELNRFPDAAAMAIDFALAANRLVAEVGPELPLRSLDGAPIRMGWGVVQGMAALAAMTRSADTVIGDATNVAFRLSGLAGREGRAAVLVTRDVHAAVAAQFVWGPAERVELKGRSGRETVFGAIGREAAPAPDRREC